MAYVYINESVDIEVDDFLSTVEDERNEEGENNAD